MENKERFLPIGTVVLLKGGEKTIMINAYGVFPTNNDDKKEMYEYGACLYPEGVVDSNSICAFNHDQIDKILFMGYVCDEQKKFSDLMNDNYDGIKSNFC